MPQHKTLLIAGGGICSMAACIAAARATSRANWQVHAFESAPLILEVGAGVQLGSNVTRILCQWGLEDKLKEIAAYPDMLIIKDANSANELGKLSLGKSAIDKYAAPYVTIHRAHLHKLLATRAAEFENVQINLAAQVEEFSENAGQVSLKIKKSTSFENITGDALLGADGVWSKTRTQLLNDGSPEVTGHLAYRAMLDQKKLPAHLRQTNVCAWLGKNLHVITYPVAAGQWLNVVAIISADPPQDAQNWNHDANAAGLQKYMKDAAHHLKELIIAADSASINEHTWRLWVLADRDPVSSPAQMQRGLIALAGDAAHPMRPFLAQGAGMAIEDAKELENQLSKLSQNCSQIEIEKALNQYAQNRWQRVAKVQARSRENGKIFHMSGLMKLARDSAMKIMGEKLIDVPWLYSK